LAINLLTILIVALPQNQWVDFRKRGPKQLSG
jgi:hypothetical protein